MNLYVDEIKSRIKMPELLRHYGIDIVRGRIKCPLHNGTDRNCGVMPDYIHCFVCGESADQISFVMKYFNLSFQDAIKKIDADFNLNIIGEHPFEEYRNSYYQRKIIDSKQNRDKAKKKASEREYWKIFDEWKRLSDNRKKYRPKSPDEELHPFFVESLQRLDYQEYLLDLAEEKRLSYV